jgi:hypothetical protein
VSKHTEPRNLIQNLDLLSGLKSGDRIGAPKQDGLFKINGWRNDNDSIIVQAENIKSLFSTALTGKNIDKATFDKCVAAFNGLNKMLAGYQSSRGKTDQINSLRSAIYEIDKILTAAQSVLSESPSCGTNIVIAKNAIKYLDSLKLPSTNVKFNGHYKDEVDMFVGRYLRQEHRYKDQSIVNRYHSHITRKIPIDPKKPIAGGNIKENKYESYTAEQAKKLLEDHNNIRKDILTIIRNITSKSETRRQLKQLLSRVKSQYGYSDELWEILSYQFHFSDGTDEERIRLTRKAIKFGVANCYEKSAIVATHMLEATRGNKSIFWVACIKYDHCFTIIADKNLLTTRDIETKPAHEWTGDAIIVDGWTSDYYPAVDIRKSRGAFNIFKGVARKGIIRNFNQIAEDQKDKKDKEDKNKEKDMDLDSFLFEVMGAAAEDTKTTTAILVRESLSWPPTFDPGFRLAVAKSKNIDYRINTDAIKSSDLARVSDNPELLISNLSMIIKDQ